MAIGKTKRGLRVVLASALIVWLVREADLARLFDELRNLDSFAILAAICMVFATNCLRAANWHQLLRGLGVAQSASYKRTLYCHFCGGLIGQVIPSTAGMDAVRACFAQHSFRSPVAVTGASVFVLNAVSWVATCAFALLGMQLLHVDGELPPPLSVAAAPFFGALAGAVLAYLVLRRKKAQVLRRLSAGVRRNPLRKALSQFVEALFVFEKAHVRLAPVFLVASVVHASQAVSFLLVAEAMGISLRFAEAVILLPIGALANLAPISIAGFGLPQLAVGTGLTMMGVPRSQALLIPALWASIQLLIYIMAGGIAWLRGPEQLPPLPRKA